MLYCSRVVNGWNTQIKPRVFSVLFFSDVINKFSSISMKRWNCCCFVDIHHPQPHFGSVCLVSSPKIRCESLQSDMNPVTKRAAESPMKIIDFWLTPRPSSLCYGFLFHPLRSAQSPSGGEMLFLKVLAVTSNSAQVRLLLCIRTSSDAGLKFN